jgi:hypothetical protein
MKKLEKLIHFVLFDFWLDKFYLRFVVDVFFT